MTNDDIWLPGLVHSPSPNADARPAGSRVDLLVIHCISLPPGIFGGTHIRDLFMNRLQTDADPYFTTIAALRVSAHLVIYRDGGAEQFVPLNRRAWHAGESIFDGRSRCNDFSIGIELEGTDSTPYSLAQYRRLTDVTRLVQQHFPAINAARIVGHSDISPGRKTDPGPCFDWASYHACIGGPEAAPADSASSELA